jgi:electron transfer flavoprotein alpha subunit
MATLEPGSFRAPFEDPYRKGDIETVDVDLSELEARLQWTDVAAVADLPAVPLSKAGIVVAAGRGMGDADGFALVEQLAEVLGGVVAGSRGAFDKGWIAEEQIVGVGGTSIEPELYVACGLAGDIYHYFGVQDAKFIVALNADEDAPIMKTANMAVVGDAKQVLSAMLEALAG